MEAWSNDRKLIGVEAAWVHAEKEKRILMGLDLNTCHAKGNKTQECKKQAKQGSSEELRIWDHAEK